MEKEKIYLPHYIIKEIIDILSDIPEDAESKERAEYLKMALMLRMIKRG